MPHENAKNRFVGPKAVPEQGCGATGIFIETVAVQAGEAPLLHSRCRRIVTINEPERSNAVSSIAPLHVRPGIPCRAVSEKEHAIPVTFTSG